MGALVVMAASSQVETDGIIICSPGFDGHPQAFSLGYKVKSLLSALFTPQREVNLPYQLDLVTRSLAVRAWLTNLTAKRMSVPGSMLFELLKLSQNVIANLTSVKAPVLMITAGQERVVNNQVSQKLFDKLQAPSKKHICMQDAWHDLMFDPQIDEVAEEIANWQGNLQAPNGNSMLKAAPQADLAC
jgi:alpha-beta hydrolase superfamily lysophospholipase